MRIAIVYNARPTNLERTDPTLERLIEGDEWKTIEAIGNALSQDDHVITYLPIGLDIYNRLEKIKSKIDLILNFSEGVGRGSDREAQIPMLAEILGIPYTGPGPLSSALILNKSRAKEIWKANGVETAPWQLFTSSKEKLKPSLHYPLIVKPNNEGSGIGIKSSSVVKNKKELVSAIDLITKEYNQTALVETYLPGREFTVAIIGNGDDAFTLPIVEINFDSFPDGAPRIDSYEAKFVYGVTGQAEMDKTEFCPAIIPKKLEDTINNLALSCYLAIGCRDFGRVDLRMDEQGKVYVMEINHPPGLMSDPGESSFFTIAARVHGMDLRQMLGSIIGSATKRLKL